MQGVRVHMHPSNGVPAVFYSIFQLFIVGIFWGSTNPFLKAATNKVKRDKTLNIISEVVSHLTNWHYLIPFLINQSGSLLFYFTLKYTDISLAVPIANGVSLVSTSVVGTLIGEEKPNFRTIVGILFLLFELFEYVEEALEDISEWNDNDTSEKARRLRISMLNSEFIICLFVLNKVFALGLVLSKVLQQTSIDLKEAMSLAQDTKQELTEIRLNAEKEFGDIFKRVKSLAEKIDIAINMLRISKRQTNSDYEEDFISLTKQYIEDLEDIGNCYEVFKNEFKLWQRKLKCLSETDKLKNAMDAIYICNEAMYPNIFKLLKILATLPVSSATNERTFSTLKRIKTYLRNSTSEGRLNGLAMLSINKNDSITPDEVLVELSNKKGD
ncbi:hypothetical protein QTP88_027731 [Uroleucon formosanum]